MSLWEDNKAIGVIKVVNNTKYKEMPSIPKFNWINSKLVISVTNW